MHNTIRTVDNMVIAIAKSNFNNESHSFKVLEPNNHRRMEKTIQNQ